jgi:hypothetical protein
MFFFIGPNTGYPRLKDLLRALLILFLITPILVRAQSGGKYDATGTGGSHTIQGYVYLPAGDQEGTMIKVKIESTNSTGLSAIADPNGAFTFRNLEPGPYYLTVDAGDGFEIYKETINIDREISKSPRTVTVPVYLRRKPNSPISSGTVDASLAGVPNRPSSVTTRRASWLWQATARGPSSS